MSEPVSGAFRRLFDLLLAYEGCCEAHPCGPGGARRVAVNAEDYQEMCDLAKVVSAEIQHIATVDQDERHLPGPRWGDPFDWRRRSLEQERVARRLIAEGTYDARVPPRTGEVVLGLYDGDWLPIRWEVHRACMLGARAGALGEGWVDVANGLPVDEPEAWRSKGGDDA